MRFTSEARARVLEMQNFTPGLHEVPTYIRTIFSEPKFLGCIDNQILDVIKTRKTDVQGYIQQITA